jgi:hypothetical protein
MPNALGKSQLMDLQFDYDRLARDTHTDTAKRKPYDETYILRYSSQFIGLSGSFRDRECERTPLAIVCCVR